MTHVVPNPGREPFIKLAVITWGLTILTAAYVGAVCCVEETTSQARHQAPPNAYVQGPFRGLFFFAALADATWPPAGAVYSTSRTLKATKRAAGNAKQGCRVKGVVLCCGLPDERTYKFQLGFNR